MKRRILSLLLALTLVLTVPALAAETAPVRTKTYSGQFSDVAVGSTFYENVAALYEYGLTVGKADGTFGPQDSVTVGQAVIFAARPAACISPATARQAPPPTQATASPPPSSICAI